jgi:hypothetical protein
VLNNEWSSIRHVVAEINGLVNNAILRPGRCSLTATGGYYSVHVVDSYSNPQICTPDAIFSAFAESFCFPEYYGYGLAALYDCMTEGHFRDNIVLLIGLRPQYRQLFVPVFSTLDRVCQFHRDHGRLCAVYVVDGPIALSPPKL